jgi:ABC-type lipoprotein export system ATPase subunit
MISVHHLTYAYTEHSTIQFPDFTFQQGTSGLLLGESGSGKTTLLHVIGGLLRSYQGSVKVQNQELKTLSESQLDAFRGKHIGFIFQKNHLIQALSVEENIRLAAYLGNQQENESRLTEVLKILDLEAKRHSKIAALSLGQAQRVAIARAVYNHPALILADEPTSALDDKNCDRVIQLLLDVAKENNATLLVATHDQRLKNVITNQVIIPSV